LEELKELARERKQLFRVLVEEMAIVYLVATRKEEEEDPAPNNRGKDSRI
jgi:hypothetical protein